MSRPILYITMSKGEQFHRKFMIKEIWTLKITYPSYCCWSQQRQHLLGWWTTGWESSQFWRKEKAQILELCIQMFVKLTIRTISILKQSLNSISKSEPYKRPSYILNVLCIINYTLWTRNTLLLVYAMFKINLMWCNSKFQSQTMPRKTSPQSSLIV